jgi:hypothetical protein
VIYELRVYTANPGKMEALHARFRDHTRGIFEKHGIKSVGYWVQTEPETGAGDLIYIVAHPDREAAAAAWTAFRADPEWVAVKSASESDGITLAAKVTSQFMEPTDYSALQ